MQVLVVRTYVCVYDVVAGLCMKVRGADTYRKFVQAAAILCKLF